jgi:hypothetical protein
MIESEKGFDDISLKQARIDDVEPDIKTRKKNVTAPHMVKSKKEWYEHAQALEKQLNEKPLITPDQSKSIVNGLLSGLEVITKLPYTETSIESKDALGNSMAIASSTSLSMVEPKYIPWLMLSLSLSLITMESFGIKARNIKEAKSIESYTVGQAEKTVLPSSAEVAKAAFDG